MFYPAFSDVNCHNLYWDTQKGLLYFINILDLPITDDKILDWSILKQIADDILKCI